MPCDTRLKRGQTISQRAIEVRTAGDRLAQALAAGRVKVKVDRKTRGVAFENWAAAERDGITDNCAYRRIMGGTNNIAKLRIQQAEQLAGVTVDKQAVAQGIHSHDGGTTWHKH